ncbi:MAG: glycoside hydrolase family 125 protein, partial [Calditrichota bacterium]
MAKKSSRREFIKTGIGAAAGALVLANGSLFSMTSKAYSSHRPDPSKRTFTSESVDALIEQVKTGINNPELSWLFENCFPNTLDTTVDYEVIDGKPDAFIITGDIDAMWLRDSTAQIWPYLPLVKKDEALKNLFLGLINRQTKCILLDPYANAFFKDFTRETHWKDDLPTPIPGVHEQKYEIDSLCYA